MSMPLALYIDCYTSSRGGSGMPCLSILSQPGPISYNHQNWPYLGTLTLFNMATWLFHYVKACKPKS